MFFIILDPGFEYKLEFKVKSAYVGTLPLYAPAAFSSSDADQRGPEPMSGPGTTARPCDADATPRPTPLPLLRTEAAPNCSVVSGTGGEA